MQRTRRRHHGSLVGRNRRSGRGRRAGREGIGGDLDAFSVSVGAFLATGMIAVAATVAVSAATARIASHAGGAIIAVVGFATASATGVSPAGPQRENPADQPDGNTDDPRTDLAKAVNGRSDARGAFHKTGKIAAVSVGNHELAAERTATAHGRAGIAAAAIVGTGGRADTFIITDADGLP